MLGVICTVTIMERADMIPEGGILDAGSRFRIRGPETPSSDIVNVAIDPQTLDQLGLVGVPPRFYHVKLIENLYKAGAKAVLLDILFLTYTGTGGGTLAVHPSGRIHSIPTFSSAIRHRHRTEAEGGDETHDS
jgi:CHASE2 domain-containing sensor protein